MLDGLLHDLRYGARMLARQPGFTVVATLTLALGMGANTAIFTVLHAVVLRDLPYRAADRLAAIWVDFGDLGQSLPAVSPQDFRDLQHMSRLFDGFAAGSGTTASLTGGGEPEQVDLGRVSHNLFPLLGVEPALGRGFFRDEDVDKGPAVVILGDGLWQRRFGGDPGVIGRTIQVNGAAHLVVGVMPAGFRLLLPPEAFLLKDSELWAPLQDPYTEPRNRTLFTVFGRLQEGVTWPQAQEEMSAIAARLRDEHAIHQQADTRIRAVALHHDIVKHVRPALLVVAGAVGLVLLIACGNVANLLLARATAREREIAVRLALGAGRARIVRQILTESLLLAAGGGTLGLLLASWGIELLLALRPTHLPLIEEAGINGPALAFNAAATLLTVFLFGLLPALQVSRPRLSSSLQEGGRSQTAAGARPLHRLVVVGEVALSLVLLVGVGLLLRGFASLQSVSPGFDPDGVLTLRVSLPRHAYRSDEERAGFYRQLEEKLRALPGVESAGAVEQLPLTGGGWMAPYAYDEETERNWESVSADARVVTTGYFDALGIRLMAGRSFDDQDTRDGRQVAVVDELLARKAWPGQDAVGKRLKLPVFGPEGVTREWIDVVGVVEHVRLHDLARDGREQVYLPHRQRSSRALDLVLRSSGDPAALAQPAGAAVHSLDRDLPVQKVRPMADYVSGAMAQARFTLILIGIFGGIALLLATIGLYGVISYTVSLRTREFGIRLALGARSPGIVRLVLGQGMKLALIGVAAGLAGSFAAGRVLSGLLFGVSPTDPLTYIVVPLLLAAVTLLACYVPARRATRVDPIAALRCE
jgi:predicted permease